MDEKFVEELDSLQRKPPYAFDDVDLSGTLLQADESLLKKLCDDQLNRGGNGDVIYVPASGKILVLLAGLEGGRESLFSGGLLAIGILVAELERGSTEPSKPAVFFPFMFSDHTSFMMAMRMVLGYPIFPARFPSRYEVGTDVFVDEDSTSISAQTILRVVLDMSEGFSLTGRKAVDSGDGPVWSSADFVGPVFSGTFSREWEAIARRKYLPVIQLRQIRDDVDRLRASHREFVESGWDLAGLELKVHKIGGNLTFYTYRTLAIADHFWPDAVAQSCYTVSCKSFFTARGRLEINSRRNRVARAVSKNVSYVETVGDPRIPPPYCFSDVKIRGFKLEADRTALQGLCDKYLNLDPQQGFRYCPATNQLLVEVLSYASMRSLAPPNAWRRANDAVSQNELLFRILVGKVEEDGSEATDPMVFSPLVFVDQLWSLISGREVIGYPKAFASFVPDGEKANGILKESWSRLDIYKHTWDPDGVRQMPVIVEMRRPEVAKDVPVQQVPLEFLRASHQQGPFVWGQEDFANESEFSQLFAKDWLNVRGRGLRTIQFKQFRSAVDSKCAAYKALVEGEYTLNNFKVAFPPGIATLKFPGASQRDIAALFGLVADSPISIPSGSWYQASCDFDLEMVDPLD